ncbi:phage tail tape measure protein, TP901 family [Desulfitobacterium hafniense DCB-2]|uniref:Phage tail tape measure protein, TP901 family n=1 Tax=Desulfitobacterium hafniense (strain DSM 10664 / DCB-2) TaxID=272564 RepID=B8FNZ4_DESHD|nr:phage tail tape measure protein [Desulfitobacterium hafniense]ACL19519.1 phage tail tape measure protein, TP901 family [Desulfitobacterium hafniense DCB-2]
MADDLEKRITAKMVLDSSGFNSSIQGVNQQLRLAQSELKASSEQLGVFGTNTERLKATTEGLSRQIDLQRQKVDIYQSSIQKTTEKLQNNIKARDELKKKLEEATAKYNESIKLYGKESEEANKAKESVDKLTEEYKQKQKQVENNSKTINNYTVKMNQAEEGLAKMQGELQKTNDELAKSENKWLNAGKALEETSQKLKTTGESVGNVGGVILKATAPLVGLGAASLKFGIEFESAFAGVKKTVTATEEQLAGLSQGIRDLSKQMPQTASEIAGVAEAAGQLGIKTESILGFTKTMVMLGDTTNLTSEQAATDLARLANITQMPQTQFDRLGSSIVALGNTMATTESEIVSMSLRLAAQGKQVGMSEAEIAALAGTMSSLGIEAEAGGTAMTTTLKKIQTAVAEGGSDLKAFADVARMSSQDFANLFNEDAVSALDAFVKGLAGSSAEGKNLTTILSDLGITGIRESDTLLRMAGASELLSSAVETSTQAWEENVALSNEAEQRYQTTGSRLLMLKNQFIDVGIKLGEVLIPYVETAALKVGEFADWLGQLDKSTLDTTTKIVGLTVAFGGILKIGGGAISTVGSIAGGLGKLSTALGGAKLATAGIGTAASVAGGVSGLGALTAGLGSAAVAVAPFVLAAGGIAAVGYGINKSMSQEAVPAVDLFADHVEMTAEQVELASQSMGAVVETTTTQITEGTKEAVGAYLELDNQATETLSNLYINSTTITSQIADDMVGQYSSMTSQIKVGLDKHHQQLLSDMELFFTNSRTLSDAEEKEVLAKLQNDNNAKKAEIDNYTKQIQEILIKASEDKRALTLEEQQEINEIQEKMRVNAVKSLSDSEVESKVILERLKEYSTRITAEQASEVIANAERQRKEAVDKAEQQYQETVKNIIRMRDETGVISADQADRLIKDATRQKNEGIVKAQELKDGVVEKIRSMNRDILNDINITDGSIKNGWNKLKDWFGNNPITRWVRTQMSGEDNLDIGQNWAGTSSWRGGLTTLHERGWEIFDLPKGTRVYPHEASVELVNKMAQSFASQSRGGFGLGKVEVNLNVHGNLDKSILPQVERVLESSSQKIVKELNKMGVRIR